MQKINFESGLSMVEMLGTLAIVGVLSIGGIAGYSYGMDKYRANETINDVNLRAVDLIAQASRGGDLSLAEWPTKTRVNYDIGLEVDTTTHSTEGGIYVDKVPQHVCEIIADSIPDNIELTINSTDFTHSCDEENKMVFYYASISNALGKTCNGPVVNGKCEPCETGSIWNEEENECFCPNGCSLDAPFLSTDAGVEGCSPCPSNAVSTGCGCDAGCPENYYFVDGSHSVTYSHIFCHPCPAGSTSQGGRATECICKTGTFHGCWDGTSSCDGPVGCRHPFEGQ